MEELNLLQKASTPAPVLLVQFSPERLGDYAAMARAFGAYGEGYLRFSIANSMENLDKALDKINTWAKKNL